MKTRISTLIETSVDIGTGIFIAYAINTCIILPLYDQKVLTSSLLMVLIFTAASMVRSYFWRRFFIHGWPQKMSDWLRTNSRYTRKPPQN